MSRPRKNKCGDCVWYHAMQSRCGLTHRSVNLDDICHCTVNNWKPRINKPRNQVQTSFRREEIDLLFGLLELNTTHSFVTYKQAWPEYRRLVKKFEKMREKHNKQTERQKQ